MDRVECAGVSNDAGLTTSDLLFPPGFGPLSVEPRSDFHSFIPNSVPAEESGEDDLYQSQDEQEEETEVDSELDEATMTWTTGRKTVNNQ